MSSLTADTILSAAFDRGMFFTQPVAERDQFIAVHAKLVGKKPARLGDLDTFVQPLVDAGLLRIDRDESAIKGCPGGRSRPATVVRTNYRLTAAGNALRIEAMKARPHLLTAWTRKMLGI